MLELLPKNRDWRETNSGHVSEKVKEMRMDGGSFGNALGNFRGGRMEGRKIRKCVGNVSGREEGRRKVSDKVSEKLRCERGLLRDIESLEQPALREQRFSQRNVLEAVGGFWGEGISEEDGFRQLSRNVPKLDPRCSKVL